MKVLDYEKRKNKELFNDFKFLKNIDVEKIQNYIPIYNTFFDFKENTNINLNHANYLTSIKDNTDLTTTNDRMFSEKIFNVEITNKEEKENKKSFLKISSVFDIGKFLIGKYDLKDEIFYKLPDTTKSGHPSLYDNNNISYVDTLFSFLSSQLLNQYGVVNALDYYGSFLAIVRNFSVDISEDIEYFVDSDYFMKNRNKLFKIDNLEFKKPLTILDDTVEIEFDSLESELKVEELTDFAPMDLEEPESEPIDMVQSDTESESGSESGDSDTETSYSTEESNSNQLNVVFDKCLVQITSLEYCTNTLDDLIINKKLVDETEWLSCLFQIIMTLIIFQDTFSFTHNDLHTNNIMYVPTTKEFLSYCYKGQHYKIPTFGKIFKIIDFGRSIYKIKSNIICSNSFQPKGDAHTQYNTEPYFNNKKKRIEPNFSFDLCRLACSMWDNFLSVNNIEKVTTENKIAKIVHEWCLDDNGISVLYKSNGCERYPNFRLYKMIARTVHNHTPHNQLLREEFKQFCVDSADNMINIDLIPKMFN